MGAHVWRLRRAGGEEGLWVGGGWGRGGVEYHFGGIAEFCWGNISDLMHLPQSVLWAVGVVTLG